MFADFFFKLRAAEIPASPTAFLRLQKALRLGLIDSLDALYTASRAILVKSERHFDRFDQVFAHQFAGAEMPAADEEALFDDLARATLEEWLSDPRILADALGIDPRKLAQMTPEELIAYSRSACRSRRNAMTGATDGSAPVEPRRWDTRGFIPAGCGWAAFRASVRR